MIKKWRSVYQVRYTLLLMPRSLRAILHTIAANCKCLCHAKVKKEPSIPSSAQPALHTSANITNPPTKPGPTPYPPHVTSSGSISSPIFISDSQSQKSSAGPALTPPIPLNLSTLHSVSGTTPLPPGMCVVWWN